MEVYEELMEKKNYDTMLHLYKACCLFALFSFEEAEAEASKGPDCPLRNRLLVHIVYQLGHDHKVREYIPLLHTEIVEDRASLCALHVAKRNYDEANEGYQSIQRAHPDAAALTVYYAMVLFLKEDYSKALEVAQKYQKSHQSATVQSLIAACTYFLEGSTAAHALLTIFLKRSNEELSQQSDIIRHNAFIFDDANSAFSSLTPLVGIIPEARLNLAICYLRLNESKKALLFVESFEPRTTREMALKAAVFMSFANAMDAEQTDEDKKYDDAPSENARDYRKESMELFERVATIGPNSLVGRQCAGCLHMLKGNYQSAIKYFKSIAEYFDEDNALNFNLATCHACLHQYPEALQRLEAIEDPVLQHNPLYIKRRLQCLIETQETEEIWKILGPCQDLEFMRQAANGMYEQGNYFDAMKVFSIALQRSDAVEDLEGLHASAIGAFQCVLLKE
eukprot:GHVU01202861.1.p1 GENE.GHVU01202861.1~~GHVU01202861.1.p1  ORF type:complete len:451 (+),score=83.28 GHVU01202861.1:248-1600(+)